jgi:hypothetical protein
MFYNKSTIAFIAVLLTATFAFNSQAGDGERKGKRGGPSAEHKAAFEACATELGIAKPEKGQRPSDSDREALKSCLQAKGITMPERGPRGERNNE